jgi:hypothetical protein
MERWNFFVIGSDSSNRPAILGKTDLYEHAVKLKNSGLNLGWNPVRIFDAKLQEVTEKPMSHFRKGPSRSTAACSIAQSALNVMRPRPANRTSGSPEPPQSSTSKRTPFATVMNWMLCLEGSCQPLVHPGASTIKTEIKESSRQLEMRAATRHRFAVIYCSVAYTSKEDALRIEVEL